MFKKAKSKSKRREEQVGAACCNRYASVTSQLPMLSCCECGWRRFVRAYGRACGRQQAGQRIREEKTFSRRDGDCVLQCCCAPKRTPCESIATRQEAFSFYFTLGVMIVFLVKKWFWRLVTWSQFNMSTRIEPKSDLGAGWHRVKGRIPCLKRCRSPTIPLYYHHHHHHHHHLASNPIVFISLSSMHDLVATKRSAIRPPVIGDQGT